MIDRLSSLGCTPSCDVLRGDALVPLLAELGHGWQLVSEKKLEKTFTFDDFRDALSFVNRVGAVAEEENHHPDIQLSYGKAVVQVWTHDVGGLTQNDFVLAAKIERKAEPA